MTSVQEDYHNPTMSSAGYLFVVLVLVATAQAANKYTTKYDNIDLDQILKSERLLASYTNCLLDKGKCTPDGVELKKSLPDALQTSCAKCSDRQREGSERVVRFLIKNKPAIYSQLEAKYDPTGSYRIKYNKELQSIKN